MDKVSICHACGRTVESAFVFCPWCGTASEEDLIFAAQIESVFNQMESRQKEFTCSRLTRIENELGELEDALSLLLSGTNPI